MIEATEATAAAPTATEATEATQEVATPDAQTPEQPQEKDDFSEKFMRLARKERALQQQQAEMKSKLAEFERQAAEYRQFKELQESWKAKPYEFLDAAGVKFSDLATAMLEYGKPEDPLEAMQKKIEALEKAKETEAERLAQEKEAREEQLRQNALNSFRQELANFIDNGEYELIKANEASELVYEVMQQQFIADRKKDPTATIMPLKDACDAVEQHLEAQVKKLTELKKVKSLFQPEHSDPKQSLFGAQAKEPSQSGQSTTLTNAMRAASEPATPQHRRPTEEERLKASAALIKFT